MADDEYDEEEYLQLSGIQHFLYCRRQWALIHIEQQWCENGLTTDGMLFHSRVHNEQEREMRNGRLTIRGLRVSSRQLGISGICDAVEFSKADNGITINGYDGKWEVLPIEYKRSQKDIVESSPNLCVNCL